MSGWKTIAETDGNASRCVNGDDARRAPGAYPLGERGRQNAAGAVSVLPQKLMHVPARSRAVGGPGTSGPGELHTTPTRGGLGWSPWQGSSRSMVSGAVSAWQPSAWASAPAAPVPGLKLQSDLRDPAARRWRKKVVLSHNCFGPPGGSR